MSPTSYTLTQHMLRGNPTSFRRNLVGVLSLLFGLPFFGGCAPLLAFIFAWRKDWSQRCASRFLPVFMGGVDKAFVDVKKELLKDLHGRVLDVGCGSGLWIKYFGNARHVTELEPNPFLIPDIELAVREFSRNHPDVDVRIENKFVNQLDGELFDFVVFGNVMCEVPDQVAFLKDVDQVLKPGGKIVFLEHVKSENAMLGGLQDLINPLYCRVMDGCNCNRNTMDAFKKIPNWKVQQWEFRTMAPPIVNRMISGVVTKNGEEEGGVTASVFGSKM